MAKVHGDFNSMIKNARDHIWFFTWLDTYHKLHVIFQFLQNTAYGNLISHTSHRNRRAGLEEIINLSLIIYQCDVNQPSEVLQPFSATIVFTWFGI